MKTKTTLVRAILSFVLLASSAFSLQASQIVAFGDSGVYGKGVARSETYPAQLEKLLRQKGYDVTVANMGVNGSTSADAVRDVGKVPAAELVIVQFGVNDSKHGVPQSTIRKNIETVIGNLKQRGMSVVVVSYPAADVCDVASSQGAPCVHWGGLPGPQYHVSGDPQNHFNAAGLGVMASRIASAVEKVMKKH